MKKKTLLFSLFLLLSLPLFSQNYSFNGTISREVLDNYLERSITMQLQSQVDNHLLLSETERLANIAMLDDIGAKFVGRIAGWWENAWGQTTLDNFFAKCSTNVANIHAYDPEVICQAAVFEYISNTVGTFKIPDYVFTAFSLPIQNRNFNYSAMLYPPPASQYTIFGRAMSNDEIAWIPDITQLETQLWFYYMATRYISVGCEAIQFGQAEIMNRRDIGNKAWWKVLQKIRAFASTKNRGVVVCDAHTGSGGMYYEPNLTFSTSPSINQQIWNQYKPSNQPGGQLLFDFHSMWINFQEYGNCTSNYQPAIFGIDQEKGLHGRSLGGISPQGWKCVRNPYLVEFDNGGADAVVGCGYNTNNWWTLYGWDEISWFALQTEANRNQILKYAFYKVKCIDPNGHLEMPGMRNVTPYAGAAEWAYRANTGIHNQQVTIKNLWNGVHTGSNNWVSHSFTDEEVYNPPNPKNASSSLIFVGYGRAYYIGNDGYIHGYIKDYKNNFWQPVSPSYSAQNNYGQSVTTQAKAGSNLVASPDGKTLLYIGNDGFIYGFNIHTEWDYTYFELGKTNMTSQQLRAASDLQFTSNNRVFYVARELGNASKKRVHGFIKSGSTWITTSPTHASDVFSTSHIEVGGALTYNPYDNRLYYVGIDGFLYYHTILSDWTFTYNVVPQTALIAQNIRITPSKLAIKNNKIFYIGKELASSNDLRIHALVYSGTTWNTVSPSHSASFYNAQPLSSQPKSNGREIAISPDGLNIAYIGTGGSVHFYKDISGGWNFTHNTPKGSDGSIAYTSLQYLDNYNIFYISTGLSGTSSERVRNIRFQESYCENPAIKAIEYTFVYAKSEIELKNDKNQEVAYYKGYSATMKNQIEQQAIKKVSEQDLMLYPNPATDEITIVSNNKNLANIKYKISNPIGTIFKEGELTNNWKIAISNLPAGTYFIVFTDQYYKTTTIKFSKN